jgi:hypothetical protein
VQYAGVPLRLWLHRRGGVDMMAGIEEGEFCLKLFSERRTKGENRGGAVEAAVCSKKQEHTRGVRAEGVRWSRGDNFGAE